MHRNVELDPSIFLKNQELRVSNSEKPTPKLVRGSIKFSKSLNHNPRLFQNFEGKKKWEPDNTSCNLLVMHVLNSIC
jgi:hypothetical protein